MAEGHGRGARSQSAIHHPIHVRCSRLAPSWAAPPFAGPTCFGELLDDGPGIFTYAILHKVGVIFNTTSP